MIDPQSENYLKGIVSNLPESPGCYQYLDENGVIIYVGKAKQLKRRVSSYFNRDRQQSGKTRVLVSKIRDIRYVVVNSEEDALLLENNLIKKYQPRYNVLLKDDKTYPSICVKNEPFPRIFPTRRIIRDGSTYFGPYSYVPAMHAVLSLIKRLYPIRTCHHNLTQESIAAGRHKLCLEYHIKNCAGPCCGRQSEDEYKKNIDEIKEILKGNTRKVELLLEQRMQELSADMRFEEAQRVKDKLELVENYRQKSEVVSNVIHNVDVFAIEEDTDGEAAYINYLHITNGAINQAFTFEYRKKGGDETKEDLLALGIVEMRERYQSTSNEIVVPFDPGIELKNAVFIVPQRGDKRKLLDLSILNVKQYKADRLKQAEKLNPEQRTTRLLKEIQDLLHIDRLPARIDCIDNSHIQGSDAVAGCVVFVMGKPSKQDYRKYELKEASAGDDYGSMREVVMRRYSRAIEEGTPLPDLLITDGGKGQMNAVKDVLDGLGLDIPIAGLAKDGRHRTHELLVGVPPQSVGLKQGTALFSLLTRMQDEVHRFAITYHRDKRSRRQTASELDQIKGVGPTTKAALLKQWKSVKRIREATESELATVVGKAKASIIRQYFDNEGKLSI